MRWVSPLRSASLRWRLTFWVAVVMLASSAVTFVVVYNQTGSELRSQIDRDLINDTSQLAAVVRPAGVGQPSAVLAAARRYLRTQTYSTTSTLLFVIGPGMATASNHPELIGPHDVEAGETPQEQARENAESQALLRPHYGYSVQRVPDVGRMRIFERLVRAGPVQVVVAASEPLEAFERAQHGVIRSFLLAGIVTIALALLASYLAGARVSAPLRRLAAIAARVDAGELAPRMHTAPSESSETQVLAQAFNHMLDRLAEAFAAQREFIADASHELRTPLTVIRGQLEVLATAPDPTGEEVRRVERLVQAEVTRMTRLVEDLLVLAHAEEHDFLRIEEIDLTRFVSDLWDGLSLTAERRFELGPVPNGILTADPDRVAQALRNLARNAIEHTAAQTGMVRLEVEQASPDRVRFTITDDGPGIPVAERERVFDRLHRTDASRARTSGGSGLGLAIVRAIATAHGGEAHVLEPPDGRGARVVLVLPGFHPSHRPGGP
jgi:signal transduction histidine kinase